ncbi:MAG: cation:proton antiporter [Thermomicrobiales bacterium]
MESSDLLVNMVVAMLAALLGAFIAARLRQSVILGYIVAGIAIGPFTPGFVGDAPTVAALADIGIILLMFAIGVQFSLRDLLAAGKVATLGSTVQVLIMIGLGYVVGVWLGWEPLEALFFGAVVSNSSSTVLSKVLGERAEMDTAHGRLALAWSTLQDLGTVVLIVVLSALANESDALLQNLVWEVGKAAVFLALLIPIGLRVLPWLFEQVAELRNREVFVLTIAVVALGLAYSASFFGLSLALGAFVAGVVVGESDLSHQILGEILPLRDIFAGLFFVSIGMLVDPGFVLRNLPLVLATLGLIVLAKGALVSFLAKALGTPTRTAVLTGAILAQSAEFSFLLARVGTDVGAVTPTVFSLMLAGAAASIVCLPGVYRGALPLAASLEGWRPLPVGSGPLPGDPQPEAGPRGHAVICGYGRVGRVIGAALRPRFNFVVIEDDPRIVRSLRDQGLTAIQGNAAIPGVLERGNPARARLLVVALPDPIATRQVVDYVRGHYPRLDIVVRTHSEAEREFLINRGVSEVVLGEWELALEMTRHALGRFGVGTLETQGLIQRLRAQERLPGPDATLPPGRRGERHRVLASDAEPAARRGDPVQVQRQGDAKEGGVPHALRDRIGRLRKPRPADRWRNGVDVAQPQRQTVDDRGEDERAGGPRQAPAMRQKHAEDEAEDASEHQMHDEAADDRRPTGGSGV